MIDHNIDLNEYLNDLEYLVNIDSGSNDIEGVRKVSDFFIKKFTEIGWIIDIKELDQSVGACLEIKNTNSKENNILLMGHSDTVFPKGTVANRSFSINGSKAYGPGVVDMKSGLLSIYYAVKSLDINSSPAICIAINSHEEISSAYAYPWIQRLAEESRVAFVTEPARANGALVNQRKGLATYNVEFTGIPAHAGIEPEKGRSAITELGNWVVELNKLTDMESETTINVGVVEGGTTTNVVAEKAKASIDIRFRDQNNLLKIEKTMDEWTKNPFVEGTKVEVVRRGWRPPMNPSIKTKDICTLVEAVADELDIEMKWASTGGGSDANFTAALDIPTIDGLGPIGGGAHSEREYLEIDSVIPRINLLRELIMRV